MEQPVSPHDALPRTYLFVPAGVPGSARLDGRAVDRPVVARAHRTLALARD